MKIDVSEVKTFRECGRKWALTSRNYFHLKTRAENPNLQFGTLFHEALASMYLATSDDMVGKAIDRAVNELQDQKQREVLYSMLVGYAENVLNYDRQTYMVVEAEHHFKFKFSDVWPDKVLPTWAEDIDICGSIDLILFNTLTDEIVGLEHKTCKNFRSDFYNSMDEQPRLYVIALDMFIKKYNEAHGTHYTNGGIMVNEIRKLKTRFEHRRHDPITMNTKINERFMNGLYRTAEMIRDNSCSNLNKQKLVTPDPGYMKCQMCDFQGICAYYGYDEPSKEELLKECVEEVEERDMDHLDEKVSRSGETADGMPINLDFK